jgi:hypothetical protein
MLLADKRDLQNSLKVSVRSRAALSQRSLLAFVVQQDLSADG